MGEFSVENFGNSITVRKQRYGILLKKLMSILNRINSMFIIKSQIVFIVVK